MYKFVTKDGNGKIRVFYSIIPPIYNEETKIWTPSKFDMGTTTELKVIPKIIKKWFEGSLACGKIVVLEARQLN